MISRLEGGCRHLIDGGWGEEIAVMRKTARLSEGAKRQLIAVITTFAHYHMSQELVRETVRRFAEFAPRADELGVRRLVDAIHVMSCSEANIDVLVGGGEAIGMIGLVAQQPSVSEEVLRVCVATLFNLCTEREHHATLVQTDVVYLLFLLFGRAGDASTKLLACRAVCVLACGSVNTNRLLQDRGWDLIKHAAEHSRSPDDMIRCAAALRNLLNAGANQLQLSRDGAVLALVSVVTSAKELGPDAFPGEEESYGELRKNCAAALRTLTLNPSTRPYLLNEGDAIAIILEDNQSKGMGMTDRLARKIETESWANGGEDTTREGRAAEVPKPATVRLPVVPPSADASDAQTTAAASASYRRSTSWFKLTEPVRVPEPVGEAHDQMPRPPDVVGMPQAMGLERDFPLQVKAFPKVFLDQHMRGTVTEPLVGRPSELLASVALHADDASERGGGGGGGAKGLVAAANGIASRRSMRLSFDRPVLRESLEEGEVNRRGKLAADISAALAESRSKVRFAGGEDAAGGEEGAVPSPSPSPSPSSLDRRGSQRSSEEFNKFRKGLAKARMGHRRSTTLKTLLRSVKSLSPSPSPKRGQMNPS